MGNSLHKIDPNTVDTVPHRGEKIKCRVTEVYDGDTVTIIFFMGRKCMKLKVRLMGIDAPEIKSKNPLESKAGLLAKFYLAGLLSAQKTWWVVMSKWDKYGGRVIGNLYDSDVDYFMEEETISSAMLSQGYAKEYDGGKKLGWRRQELQKIIQKSDDTPTYEVG